jgi:hypothetical protein
MQLKSANLVHTPYLDLDAIDDAGFDRPECGVAELIVALSKNDLLPSWRELTLKAFDATSAGETSAHYDAFNSVVYPALVRLLSGLHHPWNDASASGVAGLVVFGGRQPEFAAEWETYDFHILLAVVKSFNEARDSQIVAHFAALPQALLAVEDKWSVSDRALEWFRYYYVIEGDTTRQENLAGSFLNFLGRLDHLQSDCAYEEIGNAIVDLLEIYVESGIWTHEDARDEARRIVRSVISALL